MTSTLPPAQAEAMARAHDPDEWAAHDDAIRDERFREGAAKWKAIRIAAMQAAWAASPGPSAYEALEGLRELSEGATAGPWQNGMDDLEGIVAPNNPGLGNVICIPPLKRMYSSLELWPSNAAFIVAAVNMVRLLLQGGEEG